MNEHESKSLVEPGDYEVVMFPTLPASVERSVEVNHIFVPGPAVIPSISLSVGKGNDLTLPDVVIDRIEPRLRVES